MNVECYVVMVMAMKCPPVNVTETFLVQDGATSLCIACRKGHLPVVEQLNNLPNDGCVHSIIVHL